MSDVTEIRVLIEAEGISDEEAERLADWFWDMDAEELGIGAESVDATAVIVPEDEQGPPELDDITQQDGYPNSRAELIELMKVQVAMTALADPDFLRQYGEQIAERVTGTDGFGDSGH